MENFWDLLFQLMKHETNTLHVAFIFLFSIDRTDKPEGRSDKGLTVHLDKVHPIDDIRKQYRLVT